MQYHIFFIFEQSFILNLYFMETLIGDLLKLLLPASLVLYAMYLVVKSFLNKDFEKKLVELKFKNSEIVLPIRLQAYERMTLFLERISPHNLIVRVNEGGITAGYLQQKLLHEIREEYNHNMSQQIYMTQETWTAIKQSMENIVTLINTSAQHVSADARSIELAKLILEQLIQSNNDPVAPAMKMLKNEISKVM
jgi:hypothetical protein